jgi:hypothetical protein
MTSKRRKLPRLLLIVGIGLVLVLAAAPWAGTKLFGKAYLERKLREQLTCEFELGNLAGGWSGLRLDSLRLRQPPGFEAVAAPLLEAQGIEIQLSLFSAILGRIEPDVKIASVEATVVRGADGITNLQRVRKPKDPREWTPTASQPAGETKKKTWGLHAKLERGKVVLRDLTAGAEAVIDRIAIEATRPLEGGELAFSLACAVSGTRGAGGLELGGTYDFERTSSHAELRASNIDLGAFAPLAASTKWVSTVEGLVNGSVGLALAKDGEVTGSGTLAITNLRLEGGKLAAPIHEPSIELTPKFAFAPATGIVSADGFGLKTTSFALVGNGSFSAASGGSADLTLDGDLRKAQQTFAAFFPTEATLEGTISGKANIRAGADGAARLTVSLTAAGVRASRDGDGAATDATIAVEGTVERDFSGLRVEKGTLDAGPIAHANFTGGWRRAPGAPGPGQIELDGLATASVAQISERFAALLPARLQAAGELGGSLKLSTSETQEIQWSLQADAKNLVLRARPGEAPAGEPEWVRALEFGPIDESLVSVRAAGSRDPRFERFELSRLDVDTSSGALRAHATAEGSWRNLASSLRAKAHVEGKLEKLAAHASLVLPARLRIVGDLTADLELEAENGRVKGPLGFAVKGIAITARPALPAERTPLDAAMDRLLAAPMRLAELHVEGTLEGDQRTKAGTIPNFHLWTKERVLEVTGAVAFAMTGAQADAPAFQFEGKLDSDAAPLLGFAAAFAPPGARAEGSVEVEGKVAFERAPTGARSFEIAARGDVAGLAKLASAFAARPLPLQGTWDLTGRHEIDAKGTRDFAMRAAFEGLRGAALSTLEKELVFDAKGSYAWPDKDFVFHLESATLETSSGRARLEAKARGGRRETGITADGNATFGADLAWLGALLTEGGGAARPEGKLDGSIGLQTVDSVTKLEGSAKVGEFRWVGPGPAVPATDLALGFAASFDNKKDELVIERFEAGASDGSIDVKITHASVGGIRAGGAAFVGMGDLAIAVDGAGLTRLASVWLPKDLSLEGAGRARAHLSGALAVKLPAVKPPAVEPLAVEPPAVLPPAVSPLRTLAGDGDFQLPTITGREFRIENGRGKLQLAAGELRAREISADYDSLIDKTNDRGTITADGTLRIDTKEMPFSLAFTLAKIPAGRELAAPLARVFPLFAGDFHFATLEGGLGGSGTFHGEAADWRRTLEGDATLDLGGVKLVGSEKFGELISLLNLKPLASSHNSMKETVRVGDGKVVISALEIDGDPTRFPLFGSVGFDGAIDAGIDLGRARLGKGLERYRPVIALFGPRLGGTVGAPSFTIRTPSAGKLVEAATKMAAASLAGGPKIDFAALAKVGSLSDLEAMAEPAAAAASSDQHQESAPAVAAHAVEGSATPGAIPNDLNHRFRALAKGGARFDYAALGQDAALAKDLRAWLEAPAPPGETKDAALADAINRFEAALALAVAKEVENPLFALTNKKKGVHGVDGFFQRGVTIAGNSTNLEALAARIEAQGGELAPFSVPRAAVDLPAIDRTGVDAKNVRMRIEERGREFLARARATPKKQIALPPFVFRAFDGDEAKIRAALDRWLPESHPCRALLSSAPLTKLPESLELDSP